MKDEDSLWPEEPVSVVPTLDGIVADYLGVVRDVLLQLGIPEEDVSTGFEAFRLGLAKLALDIYQAGLNGVPLCEAVWDRERYLTLHRFHLGVVDLFTMTLPAELVPLMQRAVGLAAQISTTHCDEQLAALAVARNASASERAVARFALFELVRIGLVLSWRPHRSDCAYVDLDERELDHLAESEVDALITNASHGALWGVDDAMRHAMLRLDAWVQLGVDALRGVTTELSEQMTMRAEFERAVSNADAVDEALLRNRFGPILGKQRLSIEKLTADRSLLFEGRSRDSLDQRLSRTVKHLKSSNETPPRKGTALMDLLRNPKEEA